MANILPAADVNEFLEYNWDVLSDGSPEMPGRLFVPTEYDIDGPALPLVIFYHGFGEGGEDNIKQVNNNINNLLANAKSRSFFIYAPQTDAGKSWNATSITDSIRMAANLLELYNIDATRIYFTGLSSGGKGTYLATSLFQGVAAASTVICGDTAPGVYPERYVGYPIWLYHAQDDTSINIGATRRMVNDIREADGNKPGLNFPLNDPSGYADPTTYEYYNDGSPYYSDGSTFYSENELRYSEYVSGGHGIWGRVYNEPQMYEWWFQQSKQTTTLQEGELLRFDFGAREVIDSPDSQERWWNSTKHLLNRTLEITFPFAITEEGRRTHVTVRLTQQFSSQIYKDGLTSGELFDSDIAIDAWQTATNASENNNAGTFQFSGLEPGAQYTLTTFASLNNDDAGRGRMSRFQVNGQFTDLDAANNASELATLSNITADANGEFELKVFPTPGSGSRYGQINAMTLQRQVSGNQFPIAHAQASSRLGLSPHSVTFDGSVSSDPDGTITTYHWDFGDGSQATGASPQHTYTGTGQYTVTLTVTDDGGETSQAFVTVDVVDSLRPPETPTATSPGLTYQYFSQTDMASVTDIPETPDASGTTDNFDLSVATTQDNFGLIFEGFVEVPMDGNYTFYTNSDDGSTLYIGDQLIVDNDGLHGMQDRSGSLVLAAGKHSIRVEYFEASGGESLEVSFGSPGLPRQLIPDNILFHETPPPSNYAQWAEGLTTGPTEDENNDGVPNLMAYALGATSEESALAYLPRLELQTEGITLILPYTHRTDVDYRIQWCTNLAINNWAPIATKAPQTSQFSLESGLSDIEIQLDGDAVWVIDDREMTSPRFYRLLVQ